MTINEAIRKLRALEEKYGTGTTVYFDCPNCKQSFSPNMIATQTIHFKVRPE